MVTGSSGLLGCLAGSRKVSLDQRPESRPMLSREISAGPADWFFASSRLEPSPKTKPVKSPDFSAGWSRTMPTSSPSPCSRRTPTTRYLSPFDSWWWQGRWMMSASRSETPGSNLGQGRNFSKAHLWAQCTESHLGRVNGTFERTYISPLPKKLFRQSRWKENWIWNGGWFDYFIWKFKVWIPEGSSDVTLRLVAYDIVAKSLKYFLTFNFSFHS